MRTIIKGKRSSRTNHRRHAHIECLDQRLLLSTTFTVNNLIDETTPNDSLLSLREAITQANNTPGTDTIVFSPSLNGVINLANGQFEISSDMTITGPGAKVLSVSGFSNSRIFHVALGATASISGLSLINGQAALEDDGGGIVNDGTLTLDRVIMNNNQAGVGASTLVDPADNGANGGAIYNGGTLTITHSTIENNFAGRGGNGYDDFSLGGSAGDGGSGGGIYNLGKLVIKNSTFDGNQAGGGGFGGDSFFGFGGDGGAGGNGGAIANQGDITLINCTLPDNFGGFGGFGGSGDAADGRRGRNGEGGGIYNKSAAQFALGNTLIADNGPFDFAPDASGVFISLGHNLVTDIDGGTGWIASDYTGDGNTPLNAKLGTFADHGGPTPTLDLLAGSPALDHGDKAITTTYGLSTDQRGFGRVYNGQPDIGAVEQGSSYPGDANRDGKVNFADLVTVAQNYNTASGATWAKGDFTGDGKVDFADLVQLAQNYNVGTGAAAASPGQASPVAASAPEPAALFASVSSKKDNKSLFSVVKVTKPVAPSKRAHR
jgi:hypothetical protein